MTKQFTSMFSLVYPTFYCVIFLAAETQICLIFYVFFDGFFHFLVFENYCAYVICHHY